MAAGAPPSSSLSRPALPPHSAVYLGLSCALAALHRAPSQVNLGPRQYRRSRGRELALQGKVSELELQVEELRRRRAEDARANEKVAGIFAAHEQRWFAERKALRLQVHAVVAAARARELKHVEAVAELNRQLEEQQRAAAHGRDAAEQETKKREEAEGKLRASEALRESARRDAQEHAAELRKHRAAFAELASSQRQLEAELARAARHADALASELKAAVGRRDEAAELSAEAARLRRDAEHKDKILSAVLRKSKMDMEDREMMVREVKMCKARRKQAELEAERWRKMWESRHRKGSRSGKLPDAAQDTKILFVDHVEPDAKKDRQELTVECVDVDDKPVVEEYKDLQEWFQMETGKYTTMIRRRHSAEMEAFTEQLRLKDEKLEAFRWRAMSMDVEAAQLRCRVEELEGRLSRHEQRSADREAESASLKEQLATMRAQALDSEICPADDEGGDNMSERCIPCSPVYLHTREADRLSCAAETTDDDHGQTKSAPPPLEDHTASDMEAYRISVLINDTFTAATESLGHDRKRNHSYRSEIEEVSSNAHTQTSPSGSQESTSDDVAPAEQKPSARRVDIHALAVSYKIKRLKQQLLVLEKLATTVGNEAPASDEAAGSRPPPRSYQLMMSFLSKHVKRYQSLEDKIEDLSTRMEESKRGEGRQSAGSEREQSAALARFLEETFQLQRYMVATGQKLLEMQSRVASTISRAHGGGGDIGSGDGVDMGRFMDVVGALLRDVQRGLEVRIARIIGDLEGTLTFHGILHTTF